MKAVFLGVGEAFDENYPTASILVESKTKLLLDCGYSSPPQIWKYNPNPNFLDVIYLTHSHADHYFGLPSLITRMFVDKRKKPLTIICQTKDLSQLKKVFEYGYKTILSRLPFKLKFLPIKPTDKVVFKEFKLSFAPTLHAIPNLAIKVDNNRKNLCYSGDGEITPKTKQLFANTDLLIHETYLFDKHFPKHSSIKEVINLAKANNIQKVALFHLRRDIRQKLPQIKSKLKNQAININFPNPGDIISI